MCILTVLCVSAATLDASCSNYGNSTVHLGAPGNNIDSAMWFPTLGFAGYYRCVSFMRNN